MEMATAESPLRLKARSSTGFTDLSVSAGRIGVPMPMAPLSVTWLTTGTDLRKRSGMRLLKKPLLSMRFR